MDVETREDRPSPAWDSRSEVADPLGLIQALKRAGFPLQGESTKEGETELEEDESKASQIVCVLALSQDDGAFQAIIATPSGAVFKIAPEVFDLDFWAFAARYYYIVTGNLADRAQLSERTNVPLKEIRGRAAVRARAQAPSGWTLGQLLQHIGVVEAEDGPEQKSLFG